MVPVGVRWPHSWLLGNYCLCFASRRSRWRASGRSTRESPGDESCSLARYRSTPRDHRLHRLAVVIGNAIGRRIFTTSGFIARDAGAPQKLIAVWRAGGYSHLREPSRMRSWAPQFLRPAASMLTCVRRAVGSMRFKAMDLFFCRLQRSDRRGCPSVCGMRDVVDSALLRIGGTRACGGKVVDGDSRGRDPERRCGSPIARRFGGGADRRPLHPYLIRRAQ